MWNYHGPDHSGLASSAGRSGKSAASMHFLPESERPSSDGFLGDLLRSEPSLGGHDSHVLGRGESLRRVPNLDLGGLQDGKHAKDGGLLRKGKLLDVDNVQGLGGIGQISVSEDKISGRVPLASSSSSTPMQVCQMVLC